MPGGSLINRRAGLFVHHPVEINGKPSEKAVPVVVCRLQELARLEKVSSAMLQGLQLDIAGGKLIAGILSGRINPSGKLAVTFPYATGQNTRSDILRRYLTRQD